MCRREAGHGGRGCGLGSHNEIVKIDIPPLLAMSGTLASVLQELPGRCAGVCAAHRLYSSQLSFRGVMEHGKLAEILLAGLRWLRIKMDLPSYDAQPERPSACPHVSRKNRFTLS